MINVQGMTMDEIRSVDIPKRDDVGSFWKGVRHSDLIDAMHISSEKLGLKIKEETYTLRHDNNDMFGRVDFQLPSGIQLPNGTSLSLGFRHSNQGRYALTFAVGARVLVCSNGLITGEFVVRKKHTKHVRLPEVVGDGLERFLERAKGIERFVENLRGRWCNNSIACRYIIEAGRRSIMPWTELNKVQASWFEPLHEEFKPRNKWSLYNCFTETIRDRPNPETQMRELKHVGLMLGSPSLN